LDKIVRENKCDIVNLRRARKQRARIAATKDSAAKRAKSGRGGANVSSAIRLFVLDAARRSP
jgi:hypothetical protein